LHTQVAQLTGNPELAISEADGHAFLGSLQNVLRHYPLTASQKALDWAAFAFTASFIYVPRFAAVRKRAGEPTPPAPPPMAAGARSFHFTTEQDRPNGRAGGFGPPPPVPPTVDMSIEPEMETE
jgi:hypothetical protein